MSNPQVSIVNTMRIVGATIAFGAGCATYYAAYRNAKDGEKYKASGLGWGALVAWAILKVEFGGGVMSE